MGGVSLQRAARAPGCSGNSNLSCQGPSQGQGLRWERKYLNGNKVNHFEEFIKFTLSRESPGALRWMCLQTHDASVPFGNFWKAIIFGIINLEGFFFFLTTGFGKKCNKMLLTCRAMETFNSGFCFWFCFVFSMNFERQRKTKGARTFVRLSFIMGRRVCLSRYSNL